MTELRIVPNNKCFQINWIQSMLIGAWAIAIRSGTDMVKISPGGASEDTLRQKNVMLLIFLGDHPGDWYFTGDYPTPGGYRLAHKAFLNFYENKDGRSY